MQAGDRRINAQVLDFKAGNVHKVMVASYETLRNFSDTLAGSARCSCSCS
jgi:hypothetical protein